MRKKLYLFILVIILSFFASYFLSAKRNTTVATGLYAEGTGTISDPYIIRDAADLDNIRNGLSSHYKLGNDIDLTEFLEDAPYGWIPIFDAQQWYSPVSEAGSFTGTLDGDGHTISGLWINGRARYLSNTNLKFSGLFGTIAAGSEVKNLNIVLDNKIEIVSANEFIPSIKVGIYAARYGGIIAGSSFGKINNCFTYGNLSMTAANDSGSVYSGIAGITGYASAAAADSAHVKNCAYFGNILITSNSHGTYAAGIVGYANNLPIQGCYSEGRISVTGAVASTVIGGIAATSTGNNYAFVEDCMSRTRIVAMPNSSVSVTAGGIIGSMSTNGAYIRRCVADCSVTVLNASSSTNNSAFLGNGQYATGVSNYYNSDKGTQRSFSSFNITAKTFDQLNTESLAGLNYTDYFTKDDNYLTLKLVKNIELPSLYSIGGSISGLEESELYSVKLINQISGETILLENIPSELPYTFNSVPNGSYTVQATASGYKTKSLEITVFDANITGADFTLIKAPVVLNYNIKLNFNISEDKYVQFTNLASQEKYSYSASGLEAEYSLPSGNYSLVVGAAGYKDFANADINITSNVNLAVALTPVKFSGRLTDNFGSRQFQINLTSAANSYGHTINSSETSIPFSLENVIEGTYTLTITSTGYKTISKTTLIVSKNDYSVGDISLRNSAYGYNISGNFINSKINSNVIISVYYLGDKIFETSAATTAAGTGNFSTTYFPSGNYTLTFATLSAATVTKNIDIETANITGLSITLARESYSLQGKITNIIPEKDFNIKLITELGAVVSELKAETDGRFEITNVLPSVYNLSITSPYKTKTIQINLLDDLDLGDITLSSYEIGGLLNGSYEGDVFIELISDWGNLEKNIPNNNSFLYQNLLKGSYLIKFTAGAAEKTFDLILTENDIDMGIIVFGTASSLYSLNIQINGSYNSSMALNLLSENTIIATQTLTGNGALSFAGLANGSYTLEIIYGGNTLSKTYTVSNGNIFADITVEALADNKTYTISGKIETDKTGTIKVELLEGGKVLQVLTLAGTKEYVFSDLKSGNYSVRVEIDGVSKTTDVKMENENLNLTLSMEGTQKPANFGWWWIIITSIVSAGLTLIIVYCIKRKKVNGKEI